MSRLFGNPWYLLSPPFAAAATLVLLVLVLIRGRRELSSWLLAGVLISMELWCLLTFGMRSSPDAHRAFAWLRWVVAAGFCLFGLYFHFTFVYTRRWSGSWVVQFAYLVLAAICAMSIRTDWIMKGMYVAWYGYAPVIGPLLPATFVIGPLLIAGGVYNLLRAHRRSRSHEEKNRLLYLAVAGIFPIVGAGLDSFTDLPPASIWTNLAFCTFCSIAILRYHLLDIRIVVRRSLSYILVSALISIPYVGILLVLNRLLHARGEPWGIHALVVLLLAVFLRPFSSRVQRLIDRLFYRDRYDYLRALEQFSREAQSILDLGRLSSTLVELVRGATKTSSASLLLSSESERGFKAIAQSGLKDPVRGVLFRGDSPLARWLERHSRILAAADLAIDPLLQNLSLRETSNLQKLGMELCVPLRTRQGLLSAILVLGPKSSDQPYSSEDQQLLTTLNSQMSMVLENARLLDDALKARKDLENWLDSMDECVIIVNTDGMVRFSNEEAKKRFGLRAGDRCVRELEKGLDRLKEPFEGKRSLEKIGDRDYEITSVPLANPEGGLSLLAVLRDVSERLKIEEQRRQLEQQAYMTSRLLTVGEMASGIAHEINNPLTAIIGYAQLLSEKSIPEDLKKELAIIIDGATRVAGIVRRLLTFARQQKPVREYVDLNEVLANTVELCAYELKTSNILVHRELAPDLPCTMVDPGQLQQVFLNILINAIKELKSRGNGRIALRTSVGAQKNRVLVAFEDNGPGIEEKDLARIFDPFFTTREVGEGTGLGLSICHGIVIEHNGRIWAESEPGHGATFYVELPIVQREEPSPEETDQRSYDLGRGGRILVVDDEPAIRELITQVFMETGCTVDSAHDAYEALEKVKTAEYHLILVDIKMAGLSGIELYRSLEELSPPAASKVIFMTGDVMGRGTKEFFEKNRVPYVTKPFDVWKLKQNLLAWLSSGKEPGENAAPRERT